MEGTEAFVQAYAGWLERETGNCCDNITGGVIPGNTCGWNKAAAVCLGNTDKGHL
jgi:hypothetical protein